MPQTSMHERPQFKVDSADDLREMITQAELIVANLRRSGPRAERLLFLLDAIDELMQRLEGVGVDLRAEATRVDTVGRQLLTKDSILVNEMSAVGGLLAARAVVQPKEEQWWWYLDRHVAERQRQQIRRLAWMGLGVLAVLAILWAVNKFILKPDPVRVKVLDLTSRAEAALASSDYAAALGYYRQAAEVDPSDGETLAKVGVLEDKLGNAEAAAQAYLQAEQAIGNRAGFLVARAMAHLQIGQPDEALADADAAIAIKPDYAEAYFVQANVYESTGLSGPALQALEKVSELAGKQKNDALVVLAKTRMATLMQAAVTWPTVTPTPAP